MPAAQTAAIHTMNALALVLHGARRLGPKAQGKPLRSNVTPFYTLSVMPASLRVPASNVRWQLFARLHLGMAWCFIPVPEPPEAVLHFHFTGLGGPARHQQLLSAGFKVSWSWSRC